MNINDLVPDRENCQEAKEKGVVIESSFKYFKFSFNKDYLLQFDPTNDFMTLSGELEDKVSAPLTDEILPMLPAEIELRDNFYSLVILKSKKFGYRVYYTIDENEKENFFFEDKKLSNAMLLLAIKLKEEKIIL
jgi:hypothetical protein